MESATFNIYEAKTHLSHLIERARSGEEITIAKAGEPQVKLVSVADIPSRQVKLGTVRGKGWIADDFDETPPAFEPYM